VLQDLLPVLGFTEQVVKQVFSLPSGMVQDAWQLSVPSVDCEHVDGPQDMDWHSARANRIAVMVLSLQGYRS
jgi:hypothetical protein